MRKILNEQMKVVDSTSGVGSLEEILPQGRKYHSLFFNIQIFEVAIIHHAAFSKVLFVGRIWRPWIMDI